VPTRTRVLRLTAAAVSILGLIALLLVDLDGHEQFPAAAREPAQPARDPVPPRRHESPASAVSVPPAPAVETPPPVARSARGRVTDPSGTPLPAAEVALFDGDDREIARAATDSDGAFEIPDAKLNAVAVIARARGHQRRAVVLERSGPDAAAAPVVVALEAAASIFGRVRLGSGGVPPVPVRVMVSSPLDLPPPRWSARQCAEAALTDDLRIHTATTDAAGDFRIDGLPRGLWFRLLAAGPGLAPARRNGVDLIEAQAGGDAVEIVMAPLYVFDVRICRRDGSPLPPWRLLRSWPPFITYTGPHPFATSWVEGAPGLSWTGMPDGDPWDPFHLTVAKAIDGDADRVGPYRLSVRVPGYADTTAEVWAVRAAPGQNVAQEIRLGPPLTEFGTVRVRIDDGGSGFVAALTESAETDCSWEVPLVSLKPDPSRGTVARGVGKLEVPMRLCTGGAAEIPGVPVGDYVAQADIPFGARSLIERRFSVRVDARETHDVTVEVGDWSALRLDVDVAGPANTPYRGFVEVTFQPASKSYVHSWRFLRPPYLVVGAAPGTYDVSLSYPGFTAERFTVVLEQGKVTRVRRTVTAYRGPWRDLR
jgi:hypothetical protein